MSNIGQAITGIAGGTAGFFIGGPTGALMGFGIGLTIGGILFPPSVEVEQPRPMNLQVQTSQVGLAIPVVYGSRKVAGNLIWYGDLQSHAQTQEVGGGSNSSSTVTTGYTYSVSMAWGLTLVKPGTTKGVVRCWAGKNLVDSSQYRVYDGSQTEPDSYIASKVTTDQPTSDTIASGEYSVTSGYSLEGVGVDAQLQTCVVTLTTTAIGTDASVDIKIQESDDGSTYTDWSGGGFTGVSSATTGSRQYTGGKQYVRAVAQVNTAACSFGVTVMIIDPAGSRAPTWKNLCYVVMENFNLGASPYIPQFTWELALENTDMYHADGESEGFVAANGDDKLHGTDVWYNSALNKVIALSVWAGGGNKPLNGIYILSPTNLEIEKVYLPAEDGSGYNPIFANSHVWYSHLWKSDPNSKYIIAGVYYGNTLMVLNGETGAFKYIQFTADNLTYGLVYNVSGDEIMTIDWGIILHPALVSAQYDAASGRIYCLFLNTAMYTAAFWVGYIEFDEQKTTYKWNPVWIQEHYDSFDYCYFQQFKVFPEANKAMVCFTTINGMGRMAIGDLNTGERIFDVGYNMPCTMPYSGFTSQVCYYDGGIWGGYTSDTPVPTGWPDFGGLFRFDLTQGTCSWTFQPSMLPDVSNYGFGCIMDMGGGNFLIGTSSYCLLTYNVLSGEWKQPYYSELSTFKPTVYPAETDYTSVAYNNGVYYAGSDSGTWQGVVMLGGYASGDVNPADVVYDILTNDFYGLGLDSSLIDVDKMADTWQYCQDNDLLVSLAFGTQSSVLDVLSYVLQHHNGFISYYDGKIAHEQFQFITPTESISDANNDFVEDTDYPVNISKSGEREYYNRVMIQYTKRSGEYADGIALADDIVDIDTYRLKDTTIKIDGLCAYSRAEKMAWVYLKKSLIQPQHLTIKLGPKSKLKALPGAIIAITDTRTELSSLPIRILSISEDANGVLDIEAVEENAAIYDYDLSSTAEDPLVPDPEVNPRDPAESVVHPNGFVVDSYIYPDARVAIVEYSQPPDNPSWLGASVYRSYAAGGPYERLMNNNGSGVIGIVSEVGVDSFGNAYIDLTLDTDATLTSITTDTDFDTNIYRNMFYASGKGYGRFKTAILTGTNTWRLTDLYWYTASVITPNSYGDVEASDMLDFFQGTVNVIALKDFEVGITLYIKCPSFNMIGVEQDISSVPYFTIEIPGAASAYLMTEDGNNLTTEDGLRITT